MITLLKPFGIKLDNYAVPPVHNIILVGFFLPTIHEKKLSGKAILRKERKASAILHRFYKRVQQIFQLQQLNKTRQKMHFEQKKKSRQPDMLKDSRHRENKQFMTPIQLVIILLERHDFIIAFPIWVNQKTLRKHFP